MKRTVTIQRKVDPYTTATRKARLERVTEYYLFLRIEGALACFDRATGKGLRGSPGSPMGKQEHAADYAEWALAWADWSRLWVEGAKE